LLLRKVVCPDGSVVVICVSVLRRVIGQLHFPIIETPPQLQKNVKLRKTSKEAKAFNSPSPAFNQKQQDPK
jgi:hypothetical protein